MTTVTQVITQLPTSPSRSQPPAIFINNSDAFLAALPTLVTQENTFATQVNTVAGEVNTNAATATTQAALATTNGAAQVVLAADQVALATTQANLADADATATAADRVQTGLDRVATAADVVSTAALLDQFDDKYLGAKSSDPTLDNDGDALQDGAFYINSTSGFLRGYTASGGWVQGISTVAGVSSVNGIPGDVTVQVTLVSGTNIKTVNGEEVLGAGDIATTPFSNSIALAQAHATALSF